MEKIMETIKEYKIVAAFVCLGVAIGGFFLFQTPTESSSSAQSLAQEVLVSSEEPKKETEEMVKAEPVEEPTLLTVDVKGAVQHPGIYELKKESRVNDAIQAAGGLTAEAESKSVNLAQKLTDEAVIYVAKLGEEAPVVTTQAQVGNSQATGASSDASGKVNLNTADLATLQTISGIGQKRAQDILDYRESNGKFKSVEELKNVSGIGAKTLEKLKAYVTVD
ncbi:helix-hairpin-helix domain-containing protein [Streptococcus himalayensis]|uniref:Competence protein CelA n=1 Tax=Streptococcus himalayensis TaxID=1888195 RepID=A0A917A6B7_9STRE|nr:helix-hairpin-helix domain-containing protein [Streptococcus himalayensis]GGE27656.1 competence protein CelA [Streptococcus himalayensis]